MFFLVAKNKIFSLSGYVHGNNNWKNQMHRDHLQMSFFQAIYAFLTLTYCGWPLSKSNMECT